MAMPTVQGELAPVRAAGAWGVCEISRTTGTIPHLDPPRTRLHRRERRDHGESASRRAHHVTGRHSAFTVLSRERMVRVPYSQNSPFLANAEAGLPVLQMWRLGNGADGNLSA